jgi:hypothetical protein
MGCRARVGSRAAEQTRRPAGSRPRVASAPPMSLGGNAGGQNAATPPAWTPGLRARDTVLRGRARRLHCGTPQEHSPSLPANGESARQSVRPGGARVLHGDVALLTSAQGRMRRGRRGLSAASSAARRAGRGCRALCCCIVLNQGKIRALPVSGAPWGLTRRPGPWRSAGRRRQPRRRRRPRRARTAPSSSGAPRRRATSCTTRASARRTWASARPRLLRSARGAARPTRRCARAGPPWPSGSGCLALLRPGRRRAPACAGARWRLERPRPRRVACAAPCAAPHTHVKHAHMRNRAGAGERPYNTSKSSWRREAVPRWGPRAGRRWRTGLGLGS